MLIPSQTSGASATLCPHGWEAFTHPEGALYFYNAERRIFTDANLYKHKNVDVITTCADRIFEIAMAQDIDLPENVELTLEIMDERRSGLWRCGYYFADPSNRSIFWVHPFQAEPMFGNVKGVKSPGHIKYAIESQYWMHCEFFPNNRSIDEPLFLEVKEIIVHAISETITSDTSLVPFGRDDLSKMLEITSCLEGSVNQIRPHSMCVLARSRFFNFCGQVGARLDADQTVYLKGRRRRSILLNIASPLLFGAPYIHAQGLNAICVDQLVNHISWKRFIDKLNSEWEAFTLYSTIILNANIAFLAVPNVNHAARISSYVSTVSSVGAIILGLLLMRLNRTHKRDSAEDAVIFMTRITHSLSGKEMLAIVYSMPYAFLLWGIIFFVLAFASLVFQYSDDITRVLVGCAVGLVTLFVIWAVWDSHTALWWLYPIRQRIKRNFQYWAMRNRIFGKVTHQPSARPSREEGALMPPDNDSESVATDSDSED
ncbi:hypothetical protein DEU56DRAFT_734554 [Suillus clintonianus]|uniref:uncharacterized protein n=1 Tax=Suillus clintonianus TaxID=1904413 RepID=UPI001B886785|nr:uncharacterized protein DEU56DRAFT_734554 [Suillus clintonianus]KAG2141053.1 hypothetical protein DEU56DRAFT_734554 [Suillus clintonianus]